MADNPSPDGAPAPTLKVVPRKAKLRYPLPTDRIAVKKQIDLLRAYAIGYEQQRRPLTYAEVVAILKMHPVTASLATPFFVNIGLLEKSAQQGFIPTPIVMAYYHAYKWNPDSAAMKLAPAFANSWFARAVMPQLNFNGSLNLDAARTILAEQSDALPEHRAQLTVLIDLMAEVGMVIRDGNQIRLGNVAPVPPVVEEEDSATPSTQSDREPVTRTVAVSSVATGLQSGMGGVRFSVNVAVDMEEFRSWSPDRISAFFAGIAQVLAAKAAVEKEAGRGA